MDTKPAWAGKRDRQWTEMWSCGRNDHGQCGRGNMEDSKEKSVPLGVERSVRRPSDHPDERDALEWCPFSVALQPIQSASCGSMHSVLLNTERSDAGEPRGTLHSTGSNNAGQLGLNHKYDMTAPAKLDIFTSLNLSVQDIQCGPKHNVAVTPLAKSTLSEVWTWGQGWYGRLGHNIEQTLLSPKRIANFRVIVKKVVCGGNSTGLLTTEGQIYTWGYNKYGQCGIGQTVGVKDVPHTCKNGEGIVKPTLSPLPGERKAIDLSMGFSHTMAVTTTGLLYACGSNQNGQLGTGTPSGSEMNCCVNWTPVPMTQMKYVESVVCGGQHTLALTNTRQVYSWGRKDKGRTGLAKARRDVPLPQLMNTFKDTLIERVYTRDGHSFALTSDKRVWTWGPNKYGQLGFLPEEEPAPNYIETPRMLEQLRGVDEVFLAGSSTAGFTLFLISGLPYILNQHIRDLNEFQANRVIQQCQAADLCFLDESGMSPLHWAVYMGAINIVRSLLELPSMSQFIDLRTQDLQQFTPLHLSAHLGFLECTRLLLRKGANTTIVDGLGHRAARLAVVNKFIPIANEIIQREEQSGSEEVSSLLALDNEGRNLLDLCSVEDAYEMKRNTSQYYDITMLFSPDQATLGNQLTQFLHTKRIKCWSPSCIENTLEEAVNKSRGVIFFVGESTVAAGTPQREMLWRAKADGLAIFPVWESKIDLEPAVEAVVFLYQLLDLSSDSIFVRNAHILSYAIRGVLHNSSRTSKQKSAGGDSDDQGGLPMDRESDSSALIDTDGLDQPFSQQTVFLSYDPADASTAQVLLEAFQQKQEIKVFDSGTCKDKALLSQAAKGCFAVLVLLSRAAVGSSQIREQVSVAENNKKSLFALQVTDDTLEIPLDMRYALAITPLFTYKPSFPDKTVSQIVQAFRLKYQCDRKAIEYQSLLDKHHASTLERGVLSW